MPRGLHVPKNEDSVEYIDEFLIDRLEKIKEHYRKIDRWYNQMKDALELRKEKDVCTDR